MNERCDLPAMWFYTSEDGYVNRSDTFDARNIITKLGSYSSSEELVGVLKKVKPTSKMIKNNSSFARTACIQK